MKYKKGDTVKIVAGKDKGKSGKIEKILPVENKVLVLGVNQYKRHIKGQQGGKASEITTITKPLPIANVQIICPKCKLQTRIGFLMGKNKKTRICRKCGQEI